MIFMTNQSTVYKGLHRVGTVSYTHLDVYKRQDLHRVDELDEGGEILFLHRSLVVDIPDKGADVSYTHLDVYKRQLQ